MRDANRISGAKSPYRHAAYNDFIRETSSKIWLHQLKNGDEPLPKSQMEQLIAHVFQLENPSTKRHEDPETTKKHLTKIAQSMEISLGTKRPRLGQKNYEEIFEQVVRKINRVRPQP
ncbi:MAG: hypothetical protein ACMZ64_12265 [Oleiphilus sp.]